MILETEINEYEIRIWKHRIQIVKIQKHGKWQKNIVSRVIISQEHWALVDETDLQMIMYFSSINILSYIFNNENWEYSLIKQIWYESLFYKLQLQQILWKFIKYLGTAYFEN